MFTQSFGEDGLAHYYSHAQVGVYNLMRMSSFFGTESQKDFVEILFYVNYHMLAHDFDKFPSTAKKYCKIFGEEKFNKLSWFGVCDRIASGTK